MRALWLYLHFPQLQLDALYQQGESKQDNQEPVAILEQQHNEIEQMNQAAKKAGLQKGMGLATAAMLVPHLSVIPYNMAAEEAKLKELAELLYLVTSDISFFMPDGIVLRAHNMLSLYGGLKPYWLAIQRQLSLQYLSYHYATGHSALSARLLARTHWDRITQDYPLLKQQVQQCSLTHSDLPAKTVEKLQRVGAETIAAVQKIPRQAIAKRFDIHLVNYLGRLSGEFQQPLTLFQPKEVFQRYIELLYDVENTDKLTQPLTHLLNSLEQYMTVREQTTYSLTVTLYQRDHLPLEIKIGSAQGDYQRSAWLPLITLKLESDTVDAPIYALQIITGAVQQRTSEIGDLFSQQKSRFTTAQLLSLLSAKLGEHALHQPILKNAHKPEDTTDYVQPTHLPDAQAAHHAIPAHSRFRPSFILQQPQLLKEKTTLLHGPERISTGWWEHQPITRDYYIARSIQGRYYWLFKTPNQDWFLHGVFC